MGLFGRSRKGSDASSKHLAWDAANLTCETTLTLRSPDFGDGAMIPAIHASKHAGGGDLSPALAWNGAPPGSEQLLLVVEDPDAPTRLPFVHCVALIGPSLSGLSQGALSADASADGVRLLRSDMGRGYLGPAPVRGSGPHRYVFQLFALARPVSAPSRGALEPMKPRQVLPAVGGVLARGRLEGLFERP